MKRALCLSLLVASGMFSVAPAQSRSNYIPRTERGQLVADIVQRWSVEASKLTGAQPASWARAMGGAFGHASLAQLRQAASAARLEDMLAAFQDGATAAMARGSVFHSIQNCRTFDTRLVDKPFFPGETRILQVPSALCGIPESATGVLMQINAIKPQELGHFLVYPKNAPMPFGGNLMYPTDITNTVISEPAFNLYSSQATHVFIDVVGYFEAAPVVTQNCTVTADAGSFVPDNSNAFTLAPPACPSGSQQMAVFCRVGDRAARLRGSTATACVFEDAVPDNGSQGFASAQARCCSVDN